MVLRNKILFRKARKNALQPYGAAFLRDARLAGVFFAAGAAFLTLALRGRAARAPVPPPRPRTDEIGDLGRALETMRRKLQGKAYVEQYVQSLTHEMKSPLAAIRGAAELLQEPLPGSGSSENIWVSIHA